MTLEQERSLDKSKRSSIEVGRPATNPVTVVKEPNYLYKNYLEKVRLPSKINSTLEVSLVKQYANDIYSSQPRMLYSQSRVRNQNVEITLGNSRSEQNVTNETIRREKGIY